MLLGYKADISLFYNDTFINRFRKVIDIISTGSADKLSAGKHFIDNDDIMSRNI